MRNTPSPLLLLIVISRFRDGVDIRELAEVIEELRVQGYDLGYSFIPLVKTRVSREMMLDLNLLKVLGLISEVNGKISVTEKAVSLISKLSRKDLIARNLIAAVDKIIVRRREVREGVIGG